MNGDLVKKKEDFLVRSKENEVKECTFKPKTNESNNREVIKMILKG